MRLRKAVNSSCSCDDSADWASFASFASLLFSAFAASRRSLAVLASLRATSRSACTDRRRSFTDVHSSSASYVTQRAVQQDDKTRPVTGASSVTDPVTNSSP